MKKKITERHQWTNGGDEVLVLRFVDDKHCSYKGFQHPAKVGKGEFVEAKQ